MFPTPTSEDIIKAGWFPGRQVNSDVIPSYFHISAKNIIGEFNGLHFKPKAETGIECGTGDILIDFNADHSKDLENEILAIQNNCIFIGLSEQGYSEIYCTKSGVILSIDDVAGIPAYVGDNIYIAISNILNGIRQRPILNPSKSSVTFYGDLYLPNDPRFYVL